MRATTPTHVKDGFFDHIYIYASVDDRDPDALCYKSLRQLGGEGGSNNLPLYDAWLWAAAAFFAGVAVVLFFDTIVNKVYDIFCKLKGFR